MREGPVQYNWLPYKKRKFGYRDTLTKDATWKDTGRRPLASQGERSGVDSLLQPWKEASLAPSWSWVPGLGICETVCFCCFQSHGPLLQQSQQTNTLPIRPWSELCSIAITFLSKPFHISCLLVHRFCGMMIPYLKWKKQQRYRTKRFSKVILAVKSGSSLALSINFFHREWGITTKSL